jgi:hypothetical protein
LVCEGQRVNNFNTVRRTTKFTRKKADKKSKEITYLKAHFAHGKLQPCESWAKTKSQGYTRETNGLHESWSNMTND